MSTFEIVLPEDPKFAHKLAKEIADYINSNAGLLADGESVLANIPCLRNLDNLLLAVENAFNDCALVLNDHAEPSRDNMWATKEGLSGAFKDFTGFDCREYDLMLDDTSDPEDESQIEPEDDDGEEGDEPVPGDVK
jgi:hypothetical protein